jgi:hypothetical protein
MSDDTAKNPGSLVVDSVERCLAIARTWHAWDGRPIPRTSEGMPNTWTPHKALWDAPRNEAWTLREIAEHVAEVTYYAEQVGSLT